MGKLIFGMTMSLNGYINDETGSLSKLYPDFETPEFREYINKDVPNIGAVIMGRRTFDMAGDTDSYAADYEYQVPIFVLTHNPPAKHPKENDNLTITFTDKPIGEIVAMAKEAAKGKNVVVVGGPDVGRQLINAKLVDEIHMDIIPIIITSGTRVFDGVEQEVQLEKINVTSVGERICMQFKVIRE